MPTKMNISSVVGSKGSSSDFSFKKLTMLVCTAIFLFALLFAFSSGDSNAVEAKTGDFTENTGVSILSTHDTDSDGDGLSDDLETYVLHTDATDKYGDKDQDGLYDFEEYLDLYGTPDNVTDAPKYDYDDSSTHGDVLDIYHHFGLDSNKAGYLRDIVFTEENGGFTNYLLWNVSFSGSFAGGSFSGHVSYMNNILTDVTFSGDGTGGNRHGSVSYMNNILTDVTFSGVDAGGSSNGSVSYENNILTDVTFSGYRAGGSRDGSVSYENNILTDVSFSGNLAGGNLYGSVSYINNTLADVTFSGNRAGGSSSGSVSYESNSFINVRYIKSSSGRNSGVSVSGHTTYTNNILDQVQFAQLDGRRAEYHVSSINNTILNDSYDSDGDGLGDIFEFLNGLEPEDKYGDKDQDGLYDFEEYLDFYGTPDDTTDTPRYNYSDSSTHGDVLDIYHKFGLDSNKSGYLRDTVFTERHGFTDYLLWNVSFSGWYAGDHPFGSVSYINNIFADVTFSGGDYAGGSEHGSVSYINNTLTDVTFSGKGAGGSISGDVRYINNTLTDVTFSGLRAGGSHSGDVSYEDNTLTDVTFSGSYAGGSFSGSVSYEDNILIDVTFSGLYAGGSYSNSGYDNGTLTNVSYINNILTDVTFSGKGAGGSWRGAVNFENNSFINVRYIKSSFGGDSGVSAAGHTTYTNNILDQVQFAQLDERRAEYNVTSIGNTIITDSYDSDGDGDGDISEFL